MTLALRPTASREYVTAHDIDPERLVGWSVHSLDCDLQVLEHAHPRLIDDARQALQSIHDRLGMLLRKTPARSVA